MKSKITGSMWLSLAIAAGITGCAHNQNGTSANNRVPLDKDNVEARPDAPLTATTHFAAGQVAESQGDMPRAITQYNMAVKLDPTASVPLLRLGMLYTNQLEFQKAEATWQQYIKVTNNSAAGYCDLGFTLEMEKKFAAAEAAYKTAIATEPTNEPARVNYGLMLARQGKMSAATTQLQAVLTPGEVHYNLASVLESQGKLDAAKAEYNEALQLDPDMNDAKSRLAALNS